MKDKNDMTQEERCIYLIRTMQKEMPQYRGIVIPEEGAEQKRLLRSLMNVRPPMPASSDFLAVQDMYLSEENAARGILDGADLAPVKGNSRICLWQGDITRLKTGAIVNAANRALLGCFRPCHSCIDNIIHTCAGIQLRLACNEIMEAQGCEEPAGSAKLTPGFNLPCDFILHTVGPVITGPLQRTDCRMLADCYRSCLELAAENHITSVAFCCISTGVFRFPQERAAEIAVETVAGFLEQNESVRQVIFDVYTDKDMAIYRRILK